MKNCLLLLFFVVSATYAQVKTRVMAKGEIIINNEEADLGGIQIYNETSSQGTTTDSKGKFLLPVAENDRVQIISVQFQTVTLIISESIVEKQKFTVTIDEKSEVNELEEIVVKPYNLSGDIRADVAKIETENIETVIENSNEIVNDPDNAMKPDEDTKVENDAIEKSYLTDGLNFANIFRAIFKNKDKSKKLSSQETTERIRKAFNDDFFQEYLDITKEDIPEFIYFVEDYGLTEKMLKKENELKFIQFLIDQSQEFKKRKAEQD